jgi:hypothetical protein
LTLTFRTITVGTMPRDPVESWKGGRLDVYRRMVVWRKIKSEDISERRKRAVQTPELLDEFYATVEAVPYGRRLALMLDPKETRPRGVKRIAGQLKNGLWVDVEVRDGRPQCVGVRSEPGDPAITSKLLRFALERALTELIAPRSVRLEPSGDGGVIGVLADSPTSAVERRTVAERRGDLREWYAPPIKRGRRPLSDEHLAEVLLVAENATSQRKPASGAIAQRWTVTPATARQWLYKARSRLRDDIKQEEEHHG